MMDEAFFVGGPWDNHVLDVDRLDDHLYVDIPGGVAHYQRPSGFLRTYFYVETFSDVPPRR